MNNAMYEMITLVFLALVILLVIHRLVPHFQAGSEADIRLDKFIAIVESIALPLVAGIILMQEYKDLISWLHSSTHETHDIGKVFVIIGAFFFGALLSFILLIIARAVENRYFGLLNYKSYSKGSETPNQQLNEQRTMN